MKFRTGYNEKEEQEAAKAVILVCEDESLTNQSFAKDADLNEIVKRMGVREQELLALPADPRAYGDFSDAPRDLREAIEQVEHARASFAALPAGLRAQFRNDPAELWEFVNDPRNHDEAVKLGILARADAEAPSRAAKEADASPAA